VKKIDKHLRSCTAFDSGLLEHVLVILVSQRPFWSPLLGCYPLSIAPTTWPSSSPSQVAAARAAPVVQALAPPLPDSAPRGATRKPFVPSWFVLLRQGHPRPGRLRTFSSSSRRRRLLRARLRPMVSIHVHFRLLCSFSITARPETPDVGRRRQPSVRCVRRRQFRPLMFTTAVQLIGSLSSVLSIWRSTLNAIQVPSFSFVLYRSSLPSHYSKSCTYQS
jgi:hypothetical protein